MSHGESTVLFGMGMTVGAVLSVLWPSWLVLPWMAVSVVAFYLGGRAHDHLRGLE